VEANKVTLIGTMGNLILAIIKSLAGVFGNSAAMIADAINSITDLFTDLVTLFTIHISSRPKDSNHKYGHGKVETLTTALMGGLIFLVGLGVLYTAGIGIFNQFAGNGIETPGLIALWVALFSIAIKEILYRYTVFTGRKINSKVVMANAWNHRSDALASIGVALGIGGAIFLGPQWVILDPLAAIVVSFFIIRVAVLLIWESLLELIETSLSPDIENEILHLAASVEGVYDPHALRTRRVGNDIAVDLHICVNPLLSIEEAHKISEAVEKFICMKYGQETHVSIHTEPLKKSDRL
jgi:cation diffusion facilitator family transporter